jgi:ABC-type branched-subunit amino acid transport system substrate-binding protein
VLVWVVLATLLAACQGEVPTAPRPGASVGNPEPLEPSPPVRLAVAFLQDLAPEGAFDVTQPSLQAVELAFRTAAIDDEQPLEVEVVAFDTGGDPETAGQIAAEVAADPAYVAAIAAPGLAGQSALVAELAAEDVPLISLSGRGSVGAAPPGTWVRIVAPLDALAGALAATVSALPPSRSVVCFVAAPPDGTTFARTVRRSLPPDLEIVGVEGPDAAAEAGCGVAIWTGDAAGGADLAAALARTGPDAPVLVGGPALRDPRFLELAGEAAEGAISVCSCADVSTSLELAAQRFIQDYQSEHGTPPGPYAVEAWDASHLVIAGLREAGRERSDLTAWLATRSQVEGLGGPYAIVAGELADPWSSVRRFRVRGGRWLELAAPTAAG